MIVKLNNKKAAKNLINFYRKMLFAGKKRKANTAWEQPRFGGARNISFPDIGTLKDH